MIENHTELQGNVKPNNIKKIRASWVGIVSVTVTIGNTDKTVDMLDFHREDGTVYLSTVERVELSDIDRLVEEGEHLTQVENDGGRGDNYGVYRATNHVVIDDEDF